MASPTIWVLLSRSLTQKTPPIRHRKLSTRDYRQVRGSTLYTLTGLPSASVHHLRLAFPYTFPSIGSTNAPHFLILLRTFLLLPLVSYAMVASRTTVASASRFVRSQSPDLVQGGLDPPNTGQIWIDLFQPVQGWFMKWDPPQPLP